ncbi:hypothetical protein O0L34_g17021 [Tuta absoluta]|nr:hypothetical protein O0L34_g17021 [Tuta absoluta]KAJ2947306.1 hypothetical protein O0L34_g17021 [Tuta absoluta]
MLAPLCSLWVPEAYVVSFKLETDESILINKARAALDKYKHKMVVANMLQTRHHKVVIVTPEANQEIVLTREEVHAGVDIESAIVCEIVRAHSEHLVVMGAPPSPPALAPPPAPPRALRALIVARPPAGVPHTGVGGRYMTIQARKGENFKT